MNDIFKFCAKKKCDKTILYNKLKTGGNDPNMSAKMRCSQRIQNYSRSRSTIELDVDTCERIAQCKRYIASMHYYASLNLTAEAILANENAASALGIASPSTHQTFQCNNPIFSNDTMTSSRNVSKCQCSVASLQDIISGKK